MLATYRSGQSTATDRELWQAQKTVSAVLHPDTGEKILQPFRMSGYVPFGWITVIETRNPNKVRFPGDRNAPAQSLLAHADVLAVDEPVP